MSIRFRPDAVREMADLLDFIRAADPTAADEVQQQIELTLELLDANPLSGSRLRVTNRNLRGLRFATVRYYPQFVILYLPRDDGVEVLHVARGRRNLSRLVAND